MGLSERRRQDQLMNILVSQECALLKDHNQQCWQEGGEFVDSCQARAEGGLDSGNDDGKRRDKKGPRDGLDNGLHMGSSRREEVLKMISRNSALGEIQ